MSDFEEEEQKYSLLQDADSGSDDGSLSTSSPMLQRPSSPSPRKWIVGVVSILLLLVTALAGAAGFFIGTAVIKQQYKSNIERELMFFPSKTGMFSSDDPLPQLEMFTKPLYTMRHFPRDLQTAVLSHGMTCLPSARAFILTQNADSLWLVFSLWASCKYFLLMQHVYAPTNFESPAVSLHLLFASTTSCNSPISTTARTSTAFPVNNISYISRRPPLISSQKPQHSYFSGPTSSPAAP